MKKILLLVLSLSFLFCWSCKKKEPALDSETEKALNSLSQELDQAFNNDELDFDLSKMNPNMVYALIFDLMMDSEKYEGKTFKLKGDFFTTTGPQGNPVYAVIIKDAQACCQQGIEFKYDFGGKIPETSRQVTVTGKYVITEIEEGIQYNYVKASLVEFQ